MAEEMIVIPKWKFKTIENALRLTHKINNCNTKETAFDREVVKAYGYANGALAELSITQQVNEFLPSISPQTEELLISFFDWLNKNGNITNMRTDKYMHINNYLKSN